MEFDVMTASFSFASFTFSLLCTAFILKGFFFFFHSWCNHNPSSDCDGLDKNVSRRIGTNSLFMQSRNDFFFFFFIFTYKIPEQNYLHRDNDNNAHDYAPLSHRSVYKNKHSELFNKIMRFVSDWSYQWSEQISTNFQWGVTPVVLEFENTAWHIAYALGWARH